MEPMNLLLVERNADWSEWPSISRLLGRAVLVLVQQADESSRAFHTRVARRLSRKKTPALNHVVVLRGAQEHLEPDATRDSLVRRLAMRAQRGLRVYPMAPSASFGALAGGFVTQA